MSSNTFGLGQANVMCEDGRKGLVFFVSIRMNTQAWPWVRAPCILGKRSKFGQTQMCWNIYGGTQANVLPISPVMGGHIDELNTHPKFMLTLVCTTFA